MKYKSKIIFADLSPFSIAFTVGGRIYIDKKFMRGDALKYIIAHERKHLKSEGLFDIEIEFEETPKHIKEEILRKKPLAIFGFLFPFHVYNKNFFIDPFRLLLFLLAFALIGSSVYFFWL